MRDPDGRDRGSRAPDLFAGTVAPLRLEALAARRQRPRLLVVVDGSAPEQPQLVWALQEAARRDAGVLAVALADNAASDSLRARVLATLDAQVLRAADRTDVHGRARTALLDPLVFEALAGAANGADLVIVTSSGKTVLRAAQPRNPPGRPRSHP